MAVTQTLQTIISINARAGNGFSQVGSTLTELGSMVNGFSQNLISFGKDSVEVYRDYEKSMKDAEVALSTTYGRNTQGLATVMSQLDESATEWAASTIFHTNDVANAISEAAHAGWDYNQIMAGIPAAMQLAQAGSLDLSDAVNYIVKSTNAAGIEFEDMTDFIDLWSFAANSSASTIGEFGDAMLRMGSTMRFAGSTEELMTLIAVTANAGSVGSEAGTMIRNSMMRLIAPTDKVKDAMALLGATSEETADLLDDESLAAANAELAANGFTAFDADTGELKDILDIYRELYIALGEIAGGYENIDRNQEALEILSAIFPTRTITEALTLLRGAAEGYDGLFEAMKNGEAVGYGEYAAETQMDSLYGRIETFYSKVERLKQLVGEELSGQVSGALDGIGGVVDSISSLDEGKFSALVSGLEVVAVAGPGLITAGTALRFIGSLLGPTGFVGAAVVTIGALAAAFKTMDEVDFANGFGVMELDREAFSTYLSGISEEFENAYKEVDAYRQAVDDSITSYTNASQTLSGKLFTASITGTQLTEADIEQLSGIGDSMANAVKSGIENSTLAHMSMLQALFGGEGTAEQDENYQELIGISYAVYQENIAQAEEIGKNLKDAMTAAFEEGTTPEEYERIMGYMNELNELMSMAANEQAYVDQQKLLHRAQTASLEDLEGVSAEISEMRQKNLDDLEDKYLDTRYRTEYEYDYAIENGIEYEGRVPTSRDKKIALDALDEKYQQERLNAGERYDEMAYQLWDTSITQSEYGETYNGLKALADQVINGEITLSDAIKQFDGSKRLNELLTYEMGAYGGFDALETRYQDYTEKGDTENADRIMRLYAMSAINDNYLIPANTAADFARTRRRDQVGAFLDEYATQQVQIETEVLPDPDAEQKVEESVPESVDVPIETQVNGQDGLDALQDQETQVQVTADTEPARNSIDEMDGQTLTAEVGAYMTGDMFARQGIQIETDVLPDPNAAQKAQEGIPRSVDVSVETQVNGQEGLDALQDQDMQMQVTGDTGPIQESISAVDGQTVTAQVDGDTTEMNGAIMDHNGQVVVVNVLADTTNLSSAINMFRGMQLPVNVIAQPAQAEGFAEGGRAAEPSIFGEAGPEWAIPEEHSERTAELLNAARAASGFTWPDLLERYGGLNAGTNTGGSTLIYSPVINAQDATGVESVLKEDKKRLDAWFIEKQMRDEMEVYQ